MAGLNADIASVPFGGGIASLAWSGIPNNTTDSILFQNTDLTNTVYLGFSPTITIGRSDTIPLPPNGNISLMANKSVWCIAAKGTSALSVIPGGGAPFQGLTQGQGSLVLNSIFSPNFVHGVSGWSINKDGSAEFNNLFVRGTFSGTNYVINSSGEFFYSSTPAAGNLIISSAPSSGTDAFGNSYLAGDTVYFIMGSTYFALNLFGALTFFSGPLSEAGPWTSIGGLTPDASSNVQLNANNNALIRAGIGLAHAAILTVISGSGVSVTDARDQNVYGVERLILTKSANQTITNTTAAVTWDVGPSSIPVAANVEYRIRGLIRAVQGTVAIADNFQFTLSSAITNSSIANFAGIIGGTQMNAPSVVNANANISLGFAANSQYILFFEGTFEVSAAGTITLNCQAGTAGDTFAVQAGSVMEIAPTTQ